MLTEVYDFYSADGMKRKPGLRPLGSGFEFIISSRMASTAVAGLLEEVVMVELTSLAGLMSARDFLPWLLLDKPARGADQFHQRQGHCSTVARLRRG